MLLEHLDVWVCRFADSAVEIGVFWIWFQLKVLEGPATVLEFVYAALVFEQIQQLGLQRCAKMALVKVIAAAFLECLGCSRTSGRFQFAGNA